MKTKNILTLLIFFFIQIIRINTQDFIEYNMVLVKTFPKGSNKGELQLNSKLPQGGPTAMNFDQDGNLYIIDLLNRRLLKFDNNFKQIDDIKDIHAISAKKLIITADNDVIGFNNKVFTVDSLSGQKKIKIDLNISNLNDKIDDNPNFIYNDNLVFLYLKNGDIVSIADPNNDAKKNTEKIMNKKETKKYLEDREKSLLLSIFKLNKDDPNVKDNNFIIINGELQNHDYKDFYKFHKKIRQEKELKCKILNNKLEKFTDAYLEKLMEMKYIGKDKNGNVYWQLFSSKILIFNNNGDIIDAFKYDYLKSYISPAVHPNGDIYFLNYDDKNTYLYKINRIW